MRNYKIFSERKKKKTKWKEYLVAAKRVDNWYFFKSKEKKNVTEQREMTHSQLLCVLENRGYHTIAIYLKKNLNELKFIDKHLSN